MRTSSKAGQTAGGSPLAAALFFGVLAPLGGAALLMLLHLPWIQKLGSYETLSAAFLAFAGVLFASPPLAATGLAVGMIGRGTSRREFVMLSAIVGFTFTGLTGILWVALHLMDTNGYVFFGIGLAGGLAAAVCGWLFRFILGWLGREAVR
ncbi:MAG: hypothetical protein AB7O56_07300 [Bauldia sp.]